MGREGIEREAAYRRRLADLAGCSERTVRRWLSGAGVHSTTRRRLERAVAELGARDVAAAGMVA